MVDLCLQTQQEIGSPVLDINTDTDASRIVVRTYSVLIIERLVVIMPAIPCELVAHSICITTSVQTLAS